MRLICSFFSNTIVGQFLLFTLGLFSSPSYGSTPAPNQCITSLAGEQQAHLFQIYQGRLNFRSEINPRYLKASAFMTENIILNFSLSLNINNQKAEISGRHFFKKALETFPETKFIRGFWTSKANERDNYDSFHREIINGKTIEQAALLTHTGKMATELGYDKAHILEVAAREELIPGLVRVWFYKSGDQGKKDLLKYLDYFGEN